MCAKTVKLILRTFYKNRKDRELRLIFVGKRLAVRQAKWTGGKRHPWES